MKARGEPTLAVGMETPWGPAQTVEPFRCASGCAAPGEDSGARLVSTASHGGIRLPLPLALRMPAEVVAASWLQSRTWWEEDYDAAWPILLLGLGCAHDQAAARRSLEAYKPELLAKVSRTTKEG